MADVAHKSTCFPVALSDQAGALTCDHTRAPLGTRRGARPAGSGWDAAGTGLLLGERGTQMVGTPQGVSPEAQA